MKESEIVNEFVWDGNRIVLPSWFPKKTTTEYIKPTQKESLNTDYKQLVLITQKYHNFRINGQRKREKIKYTLNPNEKFVEDSDGNFYIV